jgi:predicted small secreted protein
MNQNPNDIQRYIIVFLIGNAINTIIISYQWIQFAVESFHHIQRVVTAAASQKPNRQLSYMQWQAQYSKKRKTQADIH